MDFYAILDQVIALLRQRQRVTYRALKVQFHLEDEALEALKEELIEAQQLARDEHGRILVWTGSADTSSSSPPSSSQHEPQPATPEAALPHTAPPPAAPYAADAERRQLTILFCDLVDSTALSGQLDPEDFREVVQAYHHMCSAVITRFAGHIAQLLGDGLLVYFGYPQAYDDDAQRAVRTGLGLVDAIENLNAHLKQEKGIQLALRLGIHTGLVVVGAMGGQGRQEQLALGETPNIAARIQGLAEPNTLVISEATHGLVQGYFECQDLGAQTLRGVAEPVYVYRILTASGAHSRLDIVSARGLTPLVGREQEVALLRERWAQVKDGQGQVVLLSGEGGIGKSRLVQTLKDHVANEPHVRWECRSFPYYQNTAFSPLTDLLHRTLQWQPDEPPEEKLGKLEHTLSQYRLPLEESVPLLAPLLSLPIPEDRYPLLTLSPQRQRQKTLETIVAILLELAEHQPVLFILEDLHWTDPSTLEFLTLLIDQIPTASLLTLLTCRPTFQRTWSHRSYLTEIMVNRLAQHQIVRIVERVAGGKTFPDEVMHQIVARTDGVPLFVEEITKSILESGQLNAVDGHYELTGSLLTLAIPATLQDSLMARLDRLAPVKAVAQLGATIGRTFPYDLLHAVAPLEEATLQTGLQQLVEAELLYQRGVPPQATYLFKHALIQEAAYQSLLRSTRQQYHQRIAQVLEARFPDIAETQPELVAHHYTEASLGEQAVEYWQRAGERASERSANAEAISHLTKGLEVLKALPDTPARLQHELALYTILGRALKDVKGYGNPEVEQAYARARELCRQIGEAPQLFSTLLGLSIHFVVRAELQTARELGEQLLSLAQRAQDPVLLVEAHYALGVTCFWLGEFVPARMHLEQGIAHYDPRRHHAHIALFGQNEGAVCLCRVALVLWYLGYPDQARTRGTEALTLAQELAHPASLAYVLSWVAFLYHQRREVQKTQEWTDASIALSTEQGFAYWPPQGMILQGWVLAEGGQVAEGIVRMHQGLVALEATGTEILRAYSLGLLANAYRHVGQVREGLVVLDEALMAVDKTGGGWPEAELHRLKGALLLSLSADNHAEAEGCLHQALAVARRQQAKSLELRAAMSLSRLWQQQDKRGEAHQLLTEIYGWFTEGFDTPDLQEAQALLAELA
jgi:TOMM system kinase/cyclase fusion protein